VKEGCEEGLRRRDVDVVHSLHKGRQEEREIGKTGYRKRRR
jgi:hypothetical protein